jgi:uncharacterized protein YecE (DUF72 family)
VKIRAGTSGYSYKEWKGNFYPADLPAAEMLAYYAKQFSTVEINNTFYRMPTDKLLLDWSRQVPDGFQFVLKASRRITHNKKLANVDEDLAYLLKTMAALGAKRGPLLFQTPPFLRKNLDVLKTFLGGLPKSGRHSLEFRHQSWFDAETFDVLRAHNAALCLAEAENDLEIPFVSTADWGYLRLRQPDYTDKDLKEWSKLIAGQPWKEVFVFFKHEEAGKGPEFAKRFMELTGDSVKD